MSDAGDERGTNESDGRPDESDEGANESDDGTGRAGPEESSAKPGSEESSPGDEKAGGADSASGSVGRLSQYFDALAAERRRYVLYYLSQRGTASVDELTRYVVARETGRSPDSLSKQASEPVASELYHKHLPRLADYGLVEFDPRSKHARFREPTRTFSTLLWLSRLVEGE